MRVKLLVEDQERIFWVDEPNGVYRSVDNPKEIYFFEEVDAPVDIICRHYAVQDNN